METDLLGDELGTGLTSVIETIPSLTETLFDLLSNSISDLFPIFAVTDEVADLLSNNI